MYLNVSSCLFNESLCKAYFIWLLSQDLLTLTTLHWMSSACLRHKWDVSVSITFLFFPCSLKVILFSMYSYWILLRGTGSLASLNAKQLDLGKSECKTVLWCLMNYWKKKKLYMFAELGSTQKPFSPLMQGNLEHLVMEEVSRFNCELATNLLFSKYYEL